MSEPPRRHEESVDPMVVGDGSVVPVEERRGGSPPAHVLDTDVDPISVRRLRDADEVLVRERHARRMLEDEKRVRERLLATMTTELVTHANVAIGWLNLLRREHLDTARRDAVFAKISAALSAQLSLLDELVGMSPAAAGHVNVDCRSVDIAAVVRAVAADGGDERVRVVACEDAVVVVDSEHLVRALRSLLTATSCVERAVEIRVDLSGDFVLVRFSNVLPDGAEAMGVAQRVATLYGGAIAVAGDETVFTLPRARST